MSHPHGVVTFWAEGPRKIDSHNLGLRFCDDIERTIVDDAACRRQEGNMLSARISGVFSISLVALWSKTGWGINWPYSIVVHREAAEL